LIENHKPGTLPDGFNRLLAVSLFSGAGIGDLGFRESGLRFVSMNELEPDRRALAALNFPEVQVITSDIWQSVKSISESVKDILRNEEQELFLVSCTAPCQGMSSAGMGTLLNYIRQGKRPTLDPRNRLVLPALEIIKELNPLWIVFENVTGMQNTGILDDNGEFRLILDIIDSYLYPTYTGEAYRVQFANYGIPQRRERLITIYTRVPLIQEALRLGYQLIPPGTHSKTKISGLNPWVTVKEALRGFPQLDSCDENTSVNPTIDFHRVPIMDPKKYEWTRHTPPGRSAFDNQCVNPKCLYQGNVLHTARKDEAGVNRPVASTPLYCTDCGHLLPRPFTQDASGSLSIMKGFTSAYKRMNPDLPAPTISRNLSFPCSDQKIHPFENRVLSLAEAMHLQTLDKYTYQWGPLEYRRNLAAKEKRLHVASDTLIRIALAESVPPRFFEILGKHLVEMSVDGISGFENQQSSQPRLMPVT